MASLPNDYLCGCAGSACGETWPCWVCGVTQTFLRFRKKIDLAVIATPARTVPGIVRECVAAEVEGVVMETGDKGAVLKQEIGNGLRIAPPL